MMTKIPAPPPVKRRTGGSTTPRRLLFFKLEQAPAALRAEEGDLEHYFVRGLGVTAADLQVVEAAHCEEAPQPTQVAGAILSGSGAMLTQPESWMSPLQEWLRAALSARIPLLGVCFGHQFLAQTLGGQVDWNPGGPGFGSERLSLTAAGRTDPLFAGVAPQPLCQLWHRQAVTRLPQGAILLAGNPRVKIQAFRWREQAWGVQFHPEFTPAVVRGYTREHSALLPKLGTDPKTVLEKLQNSPAGHQVLANFAAHALDL